MGRRFVGMGTGVAVLFSLLLSSIVFAGAASAKGDECAKWQARLAQDQANGDAKKIAHDNDEIARHCGTTTTTGGGGGSTSTTGGGGGNPDSKACQRAKVKLAKDEAKGANANKI